MPETHKHSGRARHEVPPPAVVVSYTSGITNIDPIRYNLLFERFLNPERVSMPDIDIDFCFERRGEVIDYVVEKYGKDCVTQIVTFGTHGGPQRDPGCGACHGPSLRVCATTSRRMVPQ